MQFFDILDLSSIILSIFLGVHFLLKVEEWRSPQLYLALFFINTGTSVSFNFLHEVDTVVMRIIEPLGSSFLIAPIIFFYFLALADEWHNNQKLNRIVFLVCILYIFWAVIYILLDFYFIEYPIYVFISILSILLLVWTLKRIQKHRVVILNYFSNINNKQLNWLKIFIIVNIAFLFFWLLDDTLVILIGDNLVSQFIAVVSLFATLINIVWLGLSGLRQPHVFEKEMIYLEDDSLETVKKSNEDLASVFDLNTFEILDAKIVENEFFRDPNLSLNTLASLLNLKPKKISRLINLCFGDNFYNYINSLRIAFFEEEKSSEKFHNMNVFGIAREAGFKSKSTFYKALKKFQKTPLE